MLRSLLAARPKVNVGGGFERVSRVHHGGVERLGDDYREHGGNNRWGCWREGFDLCDGFFFFFLFFRGWLIVGGGVGGRFSRWFSKGVEIKFFCSCGRLKGGMDSVNLLGDFLILKLCGFNFQSGVEGREFWGCNFSIVYSLMKLWCDYSNIFLKRARYFKVRGYSRIYNYKQFIL